MNVRKTFYVFVWLMLTLASGLTHAGDIWTVSLTPQMTVGRYGGSDLRKDFLNSGLFLQMDYWERAGITLGYSYSRIDFSDENPSVDQDNYYASGRVNLTPDHIPGMIGVRLDGHSIHNNDTIGGTDGVQVIAPVISYTPFDKKFALDLGYAYSDYENLYVGQLTPTFSVAFNEGADWLQLRAYLIRFSNPIDDEGNNETAALESKFTHWLSPDNLLKLDNLKANALVGKRMLGVDMDAGLVYNLTDLQRGSASLGAEWRFGEHVNFIMLSG